MSFHFFTAILRFSTPSPPHATVSYAVTTPGHGFPRRNGYAMVFHVYHRHSTLFHAITPPFHGFPRHNPTVFPLINPMPRFSSSRPPCHGLPRNPQSVGFHMAFPCAPRRKPYATVFHVISRMPRFSSSFPCFHAIAPIARFSVSSPSDGTVFHVIKPMPRFLFAISTVPRYLLLQRPLLVFTRHNSHAMVSTSVLMLPTSYLKLHVPITPPTCLTPRFSHHLLAFHVITLIPQDPMSPPLIHGFHIIPVLSAESP